MKIRICRANQTTAGLVDFLIITNSKLSDALRDYIDELRQQAYWDQQ